VRSQHHIFSSPIAWAKTAEASGLGAGRFEGYKLGYYTGGSNPDADKDAIGQAATQQEVDKAKSRLQKKRAVAKILNIDTRCRSYRQTRQLQTAVGEAPPADCQIGYLGGSSCRRIRNM
jgi:hypothetical protein